MNKIKLLIVFCSVCCHTLARDYFVATAPVGSNSNTGTIISPLATIQYALSLAQPGDTVQVQTGTYFEKLNWVRSGTAGNLITLKNYQQGQVIVDGTGKTGESLLDIKKMSFIKIQGIVFQNNYRKFANGIYVDTSGKNITITNCTVRNIGWTTNPNADPANDTAQAHAILFVGRTTIGIDSIKVISNKIYDIISGKSEALTLVGNVDGFEIDKDTVFNTKNIGIDVAGHYSWAVLAGVPDSLNQARNGIISNCVVYDNRRINNSFAPAGIYVDGGRDIKILNNRSFRNGNGISVGCEVRGYSTRNITVMNNQVYDNDNSGLVFGNDTVTSIVKKSTVINNTFLNNGSLQSNPSEIFLQYNDSCVIANNILIPGGDYHYCIAIFGIFNATNLTVTNNLAYRYTGFPTDLYVPGTPAQFTPVNTVSADPGFISSAFPNPDLSISNSSAAINMGTNAYSLISDIDAAGNYRIVNGTVDIGAFERQDGGCPDTLIINDTHILKGKFISRNQIIFNRSQPATLTSPMLWSSPLVNLLSPVQLFSAVTVNPAGCN